ncbi:MAG: hypothetical protein ACRDUW_24530, partial [Pseudonocardiaceae bacterium]
SSTGERMKQGKERLILYQLHRTKPPLSWELPRTFRAQEIARTVAALRALGIAVDEPLWPLS